MLFSRKKVTLCLAIVSSLWVAVCFAKPPSFLSPKTNKHWTLQLSLGPDFGDAQTHSVHECNVFDIPIIATYKSDAKTNTLMKVSGGYLFTLTSDWTLTTGPAIYFEGSQQRSGTILRGLARFRYDYNASYLPIGLETQIGWHKNRWTPYLTTFIGVSMNRTKNYNDTQQTGGTPIPDLFPHNTSRTAFSYGMGAGLGFDLTQNVQVSISYEYLDAGKSQLPNKDPAFQGLEENNRINTLLFGAKIGLA